MSGWFKVFASPVAHFFPDGIRTNARALCPVVATRPWPWHAAPPTSDRCATCEAGTPAELSS